MPRLFVWVLGLVLLMPACASPQGEASDACLNIPVDEEWAAGKPLSQSMTLFNFLGETPSVRLEQPYRFFAEIQGQTRKARAQYAQLAFEREFPEGMAVVDVIRSIQSDLSEEFVYQPSYAAWASSEMGSEWSMSLSIGEGIRVENARFVPADLEVKASIRMMRIEWTSSEFPSSSTLIGAK